MVNSRSRLVLSRSRGTKQWLHRPPIELAPRGTCRTRRTLPSAPNGGRRGGNERVLPRPTGTFVVEEGTWGDVSRHTDSRRNPGIPLGGMVVSVTDRPERDGSEEGDREQDLAGPSGDRYREIFIGSRDGFVMVDPAGHIVDANEAFCTMVGYSLDELRALPDFYAITPPRWHAWERASIWNEQLMMCGHSGLYEKEYLRKDGTVFPAELQAHAVCTAKGKISYLWATVRDITERKQIMDSLEASENRFRDLLQHVPSVAVQGYGPEGTTLYWNDASERFYGYRADEAIGKNLVDLIIPPEMKDDVQRAIDAMVSTGQPIPPAELGLLNKNGVRVPVYSSHAVVQVDGRDPELFCIDINLGDMKRMEAAAEESLHRFRNLFRGSVFSLAKLSELRDPYTAGHQKGVAELATAIAVRLNLPEARVEAVRIAGLLHDIGKVAVPAEILSKPTSLSLPEYQIIQAHPQMSHDVLAGIPFDLPIAEIVLQHHERMDGSGYPSGLVGEQILLEARILAVADVVEAMESHRPYRPAPGLAAALELIGTGQGTLFDVDVVAACQRVIEDGFEFSRTELAIADAPQAAVDALFVIDEEIQHPSSRRDPTAQAPGERPG